uniref:Uncharacterized protein n=1 Tax=Molossus molossus TaxID=27622 RepID=A0A7J8J6K6_MOLMO|nr:hypothetical protein HJG59_009676 [Molossus molossus]
MCPFTSMFLSLSLPPTLSVQKMEKYPRVRIKTKNKTRNRDLALAGLAQQWEHQPTVQRDPGSVPARARTSVAVCPPCWLGCMGGSHSVCPFHVDVSLSLFLSLPPTLSEQKMEKCPRVRIKKKK